MRKYWYFIPFALISGYLLYTLLKKEPVQLNQARLILSELRGGDFTHAGDKEAIDMVLGKLKKDFPEALEGNCLDVGCGFGGTANYLMKNGFKCVWGIDIDKSAIEYAKMKYTDVKLFHLDVLSTSKYFDKNFFSFIYLFNVLYAIEDKTTALKQLANVSKQGAILMIFDYSVENSIEPILDLSGKPMRPICMKTINQQLKEAGWQVLEISNISDNFIVWYEQSLKKLEDQMQRLKGLFLEKDIAKVSSTYVHLLHHLYRKTLGGVVIYAKRL